MTLVPVPPEATVAQVAPRLSLTACQRDSGEESQMFPWCECIFGWLGVENGDIAPD